MSRDIALDTEKYLKEGTTENSDFFMLVFEQLLKFLSRYLVIRNILHNCGFAFIAILACI